MTLEDVYFEFIKVKLGNNWDLICCSIEVCGTNVYYIKFSASFIPEVQIHDYVCLKNLIIF